MRKFKILAAALAMTLIFTACGSSKSDSGKTAKNLETTQTFIDHVMNGDKSKISRMAPGVSDKTLEDYSNTYLLFLSTYRGELTLTRDYEVELDDVREDDFKYDITISIRVDHSDAGEIYATESELTGVLSLNEEGKFYTSDVEALLEDLADASAQWKAELSEELQANGYTVMSVCSVETVADALELAGMQRLTWAEYWWDPGTFYVSDNGLQISGTGLDGSSFEWDRYATVEEARRRYEETKPYYDSNYAQLNSDLLYINIDNGDYAYVICSTDTGSTIQYNALYYYEDTMLAITTNPSELAAMNTFLAAIGYPEIEP